MPNHVTTRCTVTGAAEEIASFKNRMIHLVPQKNHKGEPRDSIVEFDFNRIIPMPELVKDAESSTSAELGAELVLLAAERQYSYKVRDTNIPPTWMKSIQDEVGMPNERLDIVARAYLEKHPDWEEAGRKRLQCIAETGYASWYDWALAVWGTKWGAYDFGEVSSEPERYEFTFQTAWRFPTPIFERLSEMFPSLSFNCVCFDEGWNFAGQGYYSPLPGECPFAIVDACDELYEAVYGEKPEHDEDDEEEVDAAASSTAA